MLPYLWVYSVGPEFSSPNEICYRTPAHLAVWLQMKTIISTAFRSNLTESAPNRWRCCWVFIAHQYGVTTNIVSIRSVWGILQHQYKKKGCSKWKLWDSGWCSRGFCPVDSTLQNLLYDSSFLSGFLYFLYSSESWKDRLLILKNAAFWELWISRQSTIGNIPQSCM